MHHYVTAPATSSFLSNEFYLPRPPLSTADFADQLKFRLTSCGAGRRPEVTSQTGRSFARLTANDPFASNGALFVGTTALKWPLNELTNLPKLSARERTDFWCE
jgi:hypothetical protein